MRPWVLEHLLTVLPALNADEAQGHLTAANAWSNWGLRQLHDHLYLAPDAILHGSSTAPQALIRLAHALREGGHIQVALPSCTGCGLTPTTLFPSPSGNVCQRCRPGPIPRICARCGQLGRISAKRSEGYICERCYRFDPLVIEVCGKCGREQKPAARLDDGTPLCNNCQPRLTGICKYCGKLSVSVKRMAHDGPVCPSCYKEHSQPRRVCGVCGDVQRITRRGNGDAPDVCVRCYRAPSYVATCSVCNDERLCTRLASGELICWRCRPQPEHVCARCGRTRVISAYWPAGAICEACYRYARFFGGPCPRCERDRILTGSDAGGRAICGPCAGAPEPACRRCGDEDRGVFASGRCDRCALELRVDAILPAGSIAFATLRTILCSTDSPRQVIRWLISAHSAKLLARMGSSDEAVTHELLDRFPQGHIEVYLRSALVNAGVLPERHEGVERVSVWLEQLLVGRPQEARLLRPFTHWVLLRKARRRADRRGHDASGPGLRSQIYVVLEFLAWLDKHGLTLAALAQEHVDDWLVSRPPGRRLEVGPFLKWAAQRGLTDKHVLPSHASQRGPNQILMTDEERWQQLRSCVEDASIPLEARVAGALALLYGLTVARVRRLRSVDIQCSEGGDVFLKVGRQPLLIPPRIASILQLLATSPRRRSLLPIDGQSWLFPGLVPGEPLSSQAIGDLLQRHLGVRGNAGRHGALIALAAELPSPVLADLLGLTVKTAQKWASYTQPDWGAYIAARTADSEVGKEELRR